MKYSPENTGLPKNHSWPPDDEWQAPCLPEHGVSLACNPSGSALARGARISVSAVTVAAVSRHLAQTTLAGGGRCPSEAGGTLCHGRPVSVAAALVGARIPLHVAPSRIGKVQDCTICNRCGGARTGSTRGHFPAYRGCYATEAHLAIPQIKPAAALQPPWQITDLERRRVAGDDGPPKSPLS